MQVIFMQSPLYSDPYDSLDLRTIFVHIKSNNLLYVNQQGTDFKVVFFFSINNVTLIFWTVSAIIWNIYIYGTTLYIMVW